MDVLKVAAIAVLSVGTTWAAGQVTARWATPPPFAPLPQALAADGAATGAPAANEPAPPDADPRDAGKGKPTAAIKEISDEETEAAIREAEKALAGDKPPEKSPGEFRPTTPLPADTAIALPSDI
jgi:hypothetical protein